MAERESATRAAEARPDHDWRLLRGYADVIRRVNESDERGRLAPVMLLDGRDGTGKRLLAAALAALPFCERGDACGECASCRAVAQGLHPEVLWVDVTGATIKNDDVDAIQEHLALAPITMSGTSRHGGARRARVAVIIDADRMGAAAANRMLKTLEEPATWARVIMTSGRASGMLPTILSRCARWRLRPPSPDDGEAVLARLARESGVEPPSPEEARGALRRVGYSVGAAWRQWLTEREGGSGFRRFAERLLSARGPDDVIRIAGELRTDRDMDTGGRRKAFALAQELEIILNEKYRAMLTRPTKGRVSPAALGELRALLRETRRLAGRGQVELNVQLLAETAGLRALDARIG